MPKVLLIDDEEPVRKIVGLYLRSKGHEVITAPDGKTGVELFHQERPPIVLTDVKMPGMDGLEVLRKVKEISPETEVIVITGHGDMNLSIQALQLDASDFVTKPVGNEALSVALRRAEERFDTRRTLRSYTEDLENNVKEATEALRERYEFEGSLIRHSIDGIIATDEKETIITFNRGAERIFGYSENEVIGKMDIGNLCPPGTAEEITRNLDVGEPQREGAGNWREAFVLDKGGQKIPVRFSGSRLRRNGKVIGSVRFFHDLREINRLQQELVRSERLAATGQTVAGLAHCIRNILIGLEGGVNVVNKGLEKEDIPKLRTGWGMVQPSIGRISRLVLDLLDYSKECKPECEICAPNAVADEVCELMNGKAEESGIEIVRDFDPTIGQVSLDPKGIHRCLLNLVCNAMDACMFERDEGKGHVVQVTTRRESDGALTFQVSDNGCGMNEATQEKVFAGFFSTKGSGGTGLGILITQKIIQGHGGTIFVDSELGKGSVFTIRLPCEPQVG
ncbi:MAG: response regulator [Thermodesulfobacteriota bacterium]|nr:response regulator [Thermodesulfobacteriota bacterium]